MSLTIDAVFDGSVFRPQGHLDLPANMHYLITIDDAYSAQLAASTTPQNADDADSPAWRIYSELQAKLEPEHNGKVVAIHIDSGDHEVARSSPKAWKALRSRRPTGQIDVIDIGSVPLGDSLSLRATGVLQRRK